jgi:GTPase involved in cell partitioning and DNA repair
VHNPELLKKPEYLFLSKSDLFEKKELKEKVDILKKLNPTAFAVSIADEASTEKIKKILNKIQKEKTTKAEKVEKAKAKKTEV